MQRWFDLHLYLANWGSRQVMIRLPARLVDRRTLASFLRPVECAELLEAGENLILDIHRNEIELEEWDDGTGWLAALAPLRADVLHGDLRLFTLLWLTAVEDELVPADVPEPGPGLGPMTASLEAFAEFFDLDPDLVAAAAERPAATAGPLSPEAVARAIAALSEQEKTRLLVRAFDGDPHVGAELRAMLHARQTPAAASSPAPPRTAGDLRTRADAIRLARAEAEAEREAAERQRRAAAAEQARRARLDALAQRGKRAWDDVEAEIARRSATGYDVAAALLADLRVLAEERGSLPEFTAQLHAIHERHARKARFLARLAGLG